MPKSRRHLKMRRSNSKKIHKSARRGGQVQTPPPSPLSDISTNSSIHNLDDLTDTTTEESSLLDESSMSEPTAPVATNLLGQFNAEASSEELTHNTTAESSENSFSAVASSFGDLVQGGKRRNKKTYKKTKGMRKGNRKGTRKSRASRKNRKVRRH